MIAYKLESDCWPDVDLKRNDHCELCNYEAERIRAFARQGI